MRREKTLTVVCALGILACGACFLPPGPQPQLRPPPLPHRSLQGIHNIRVVVEDRSPSHDVDTSYAAETISEGLNRRSKDTKVKAFTLTDPKGTDAVLKITFLTESAAPNHSTLSQGLEQWTFLINYSATLTKSDGQTLWQDGNSIQRYSDQNTSVDTHQAGPPVFYSMMAQLGAEIALKMFYEN